MGRHGNVCLGKVALKGGVAYIPLSCSINVFGPVLNGCEREHLNRLDLPCCAANDQMLICLTKTGKLPLWSPAMLPFLWWILSINMQLLLCSTSCICIFIRDYTYRSNYSGYYSKWQNSAATRRGTTLDEVLSLGILFNNNPQHGLQ